MLEQYVTKQVHVRAVRLSSENMGEVALLTDAEMVWNTAAKGFALVFKRDGAIRLGHVGMWVVRQHKHWVVMRDDRFRTKFVPKQPPTTPEPDISFAPPYDR